MKNTFIKGSINFKSNLEIKEVSKIISEKLFGGAPFGGLEKQIYDEVPAVFIESGVLGLCVIIQGFSGIKDSQGYWLELIPNHKIEGLVIDEVNLDHYLNSLFKKYFRENTELFLIETV